MKRRYAKWTACEVDKLRTLVGAGVTVAAIAERMERTAEGVQNKMRVMGFESVVPKGRRPSVHQTNGGGSVCLRMPKRMHRKLAEMCQAEGVNINAWIVARIEQELR
jgi:hypothetical protein